MNRFETKGRVWILFGILSIMLSGCLITRQEVKKAVKSEPLTPEQQVKSTNEVRYQELDEQFRQMNGRIEVLENSMNMINADKSGREIEQQNEKRALAEKLKIYEETLSKLEAQYLALSQKVDAMAQADAGRSNTKSNSNKGSFDLAEEEFSKKKWKESIVGFEKYRSQNPKGKKYAEATYKIGSSFGELNMKTEAKAFYSEVIEKFPKSEWAKKAQQRLKSLK